MAAAKAAQAEPDAFQYAMGFYGFNHVAGGVEAAIAAQEWAYQVLIGPYQQNQQSSDNLLHGLFLFRLFLNAVCIQ